MSTTPYRVHLLAYTLGNPVDDKADMKCLGIYAFVLDKIYGGVEGNGGYELMSTTPYCVHLLAYTLGNPADYKADIKCLSVYAFVLDKICEGIEGKVNMS